ncbi:MAG TPA: 2,3,4,5-tetrahydropyridine-2,6-dicarboxylate N-acetyltransferase [Longimicrobiales bacterium]|nr:2,3,4,5-tetrahydropyridine-2,6-dicarboxylate N-acetyltransferase [Longimicrobiales bacterium]
MDYQEIRDLIANARKRTPVTVHVRHDGPLDEAAADEVMVFPTGAGSTVLIGEWDAVRAMLDAAGERVRYYHLDNDRRNSAIPLLDLKGVNARIEPGSFIRDKVEIGEHVIVMMGAVINIGAVVGDGTMIDMNAVVGARAIVGKDCHIGAGAVLAGVLEPPSADPVVIEDEVLVGANAVVLEGCRIGRGSVVAAGAVVTGDVPPMSVVAGQPARKIKDVDEKTKDKTGLLKELRRLND